MINQSKTYPISFFSNHSSSTAYYSQQHCTSYLTTTANCIIIAQTLHVSYCFQGQLCTSPLLKVIFNRKLGDYYAIRTGSSSRRAAQTACSRRHSQIPCDPQKKKISCSHLICTLPCREKIMMAFACKKRRGMRRQKHTRETGKGEAAVFRTRRSPRGLPPSPSRLPPVEARTGPNEEDWW